MQTPDASVHEAGAMSLRYALKTRHLIMMSLGTAIGAGLFLGSGVGVQAAGPAVLVSYLVAGALVVVVMHALGEMASAHPASGAFSVYATEAFGPVAGATIGWLWWLQIVIAVAAESVGAAGLLASIWPWLPVPWLSLAFMLAFTVVNLLSVRNFGEFEFWFAIVKVMAIIAFIAIGIALLAGWLPDARSPGLSNFTAHGGFAPKGLAGIGAALLVVVFAFGGTEIVAIAAAESEQPDRGLSRAICAVAWRILVFYVGSVAVIVAVVPWTSEALKSPFASVLQLANIRGAATAITLVAVVALLSSLNAALYGASRMAYSLAEHGEAPRRLARMNRRGVPVLALLASAAFGFFATALELLYPGRVLPTLLNIVGSTCLMVWTLVLASQWILRRRADRAGIALPFRMPAFPWLTGLGLTILAAIFALALFSSRSRAQLLSMLALALSIAVASAWRRRVLAKRG